MGLMRKRRNARELALKILFQVDVGSLPVDEVLESTFSAVPTGEDDRQYTEELVRGVSDHRAEFDASIAGLAEGWRLERIANVDRIVLELALYELTRHPDLPANVVINEAIEIAKKYSMEDSGKFVNGILGSFVRRRQNAPEEDILPVEDPTESPCETR